MIRIYLNSLLLVLLTSIPLTFLDQYLGLSQPQAFLLGAFNGVLIYALYGKPRIYRAKLEDFHAECLKSAAKETNPALKAASEKRADIALKKLEELDANDKK